MEFRLYDSPTSSTPLWSEFWTGGNAVNVSDGLFSVMLGSINTGLSAVVQSHTELYLGITVGTDTEMSPRVQLGSVPFSLWSLTVADNSITAAKIAAGVITTTHLANGSVTQAKLGADVSLIPPDGSITTAKIADGAVTTTKIANGGVTTDDLADNSVTSVKIVDSSIATDDLANAAVTSQKAKLTSGYVEGQTGGTISLTTGWQAISGLSVSVVPATAQVMYVNFTLDANRGSTSGCIIAMLAVDSTLVTSFPAILCNTTTRVSIGTSQIVNLSPGTHTIQVWARVESGSGSYVLTENSNMSYFLFSQ